MKLNNPLLDWTAFGAWIADNKGSMSNRELGRRVELSPTQIGYILAGTSKTTTEKIVAIAHAIGKNEREAFMVLGAEKPTMSRQELELLSALRSVPSRRRSELVGLTKAHAHILSAV